MMQIVIEVDDNLYTRLFDNGDEYVADMRRACVAIRKGTVIPKGHGRLIDADALLDTDRLIVDSMKCHYIPMMGIYNAPTIIEADKAESEE